MREIYLLMLQVSTTALYKSVVTLLSWLTHQMVVSGSSDIPEGRKIPHLDKSASNSNLWQFVPKEELNVLLL